MGELAVAEAGVNADSGEAYALLLGNSNYYDKFKAGASGSYSTWDHFTNRGHDGKVWCVASSDATDFIVSGGEDYTMRIWGFDSNQSGGTSSQAYDLIAVLLHDDECRADVEAPSSNTKATRPSLLQRFLQKPIADDTPERTRGVTAVACAGSRGPFISGTARGDVFVLFLGAGDAESSCVPQVSLHADRINDIATPSGIGDLEDDSCWFLAVASDDGSASVVRFQGSSDCTVVTLPHDGEPVRGVRHIEGGGEEDASVVTFTQQAVFVWNLQGERLLCLDGPAGNDMPDEGYEPQSIANISVANKDNGSLLFVGTPEAIGVWGFEAGKLVGPRGECPPPEPYDRRPLVTYKDHAQSFDVDQSRQSTEFLVELRDDYTCGVWNLKGVEPGYLALEPHGPAALLAAAKRKTMLLDLRHAARVTQIRVAEDPEDAGGPCLMAACGNGSVLLWDLEGVDRGEVYGELRSLKRVEIFLPVVLLLVTFFQVMSFAFGPAIKWRDEVRRPAHFTQVVVWGEIDFVLRLRRDMIFLPLITAVLVLMSTFLVFAITGVPDLLRHGIYLTQSTAAYKREQRGEDGKAAAFGPLRLLKAALELLRSVIGFGMLLCSTILVAPVFKLCAQALHCIAEQPTPEEPHPRSFLAVAPQVACYEGVHLRLAVAICALLPIYFLALIPYAVVEGDINYMKWRKLFFPRSHWAESALRKATVLSLGPLHPNPPTIFRTLFLDLAAKALLPVIETETTRTPVLQMALISAVGVAMYASSLYIPAKMDRMFCSLVQDTRLFTLCAMLCGCLTVLLEEGAVAPVALLAACTVLVPLKTLYSILHSPLKPPVVLRCSTSSVLEQDYMNEMQEAGNDVNNVVYEAMDYRISRTASMTNNVVATNSVGDGSSMRRRARGVKGVMKKMEITLF